MSPVTVNAQRVGTALANAANWRLIGLLLERPHRGWHREVEGLSQEIDDEHLRSAAAAASDATEGTYHGLFAEGGFVSPRECTWRHREDPGQILADIAGFHRAFSFRPRAEDPIDHIAVEAGFVGYLHLKFAHALAAGNQGGADLTSQAIVGFLRSHLSLFADQWAERVALAGVNYLTSTARVLADCAGRCVSDTLDAEGETGDDQ